MKRLGIFPILFAIGFASGSGGVATTAEAAQFISPNTKPSSCLRVRQRRSTRSKILDCVKSTETMIGYQQKGHWLQVKFRDRNGKQQGGYVYNRDGRYVREIPLPRPRPSTASASAAAEGTPSAEVEEPQSRDSEPGPQSATASQVVPLPQPRPVDIGQQERPRRSLPNPRQGGPSNEGFFADSDRVPESEAEVDASVPSSDSAHEDPRVGLLVRPKLQTGRLNMRSEPSTDGKVLAKLTSGARLKVVDSDGEWVKVEDDKGKTGWIHGDYATERKPGQGAEKWALDLSKPVRCSKRDTNPVKCLYCNMVFETFVEAHKGGGPAGRKAVSYVVFNRMKNHKVTRKWHPDVCKTVWHPKQYSWTHDGKSDRIAPSAYRTRATLKKIHQEAIDQINEFLSGQLDTANKAHCSDHYANRTISSRESLRTWQRTYPRTGTYGRSPFQHTFYKKPGTHCFNSTKGNNDAYQLMAERAGMSTSRDLSSVNESWRESKESEVAASQQGVN